MALDRIKNWYARYERLISSCSLIGGFVFDAIVLKRVDLFIENFWIVVHLLWAAIGIILLNLLEKKKHALSEKWYSIFHFWLIILIQFAFGGLLSVFLVFYFRSASLVASWPFLLILLLAFAFNEILKHHYTRLTFQILIFFLSVYSFAIFVVPVIVHEMNDWIFMLSGLVSLIAIGLFIWCLWFITREQFRENKRMLIISISALFIGINILYFANIIPPIPLSLKDADIYVDVLKNPDGTYTLTREEHSPIDYFRLYDRIHIPYGTPLYAFTAVFAPTHFQTSIIHEWQYYNEQQHEWVTSSRIELSTSGGREGGFRTYSIKRNTFPGWWRVNVETPRGQLLGRLRFKVETADEVPAVVSDIH